MTAESSREVQAHLLLRQHYERSGYLWPERQARDAFDLAAPLERLQWIQTVMKDESLFARAERVLISGASVGGEMLAAKTLGAAAVDGTETDLALAEICKTRFGDVSGLDILSYDGRNLPWPDALFDVVVSGHVIEHTFDPPAYLADHIRVVADGGIFCLEFPNRYHHIELHTGLPSLEWLPRRVRNAGLTLLSSRWSRLPTNVRQRYESILTTGLKQISLRSVKRWMTAGGLTLRHTARVAPGIVRGVWVKEPPGAD